MNRVERLVCGATTEISKPGVNDHNRIKPGSGGRAVCETFGNGPNIGAAKTLPPFQGLIIPMSPTWGLRPRLTSGAASRLRLTNAGFIRFGLHLLLLSIAAAFLFPFVWMLLTSAKTDEEVAAGRWLPALPTHQWESPYETVDAAGKPIAAGVSLLDLQVRLLDASIISLKPDWRHSAAGKGNELRPQPDGTVRWHYRFPAPGDVAIETPLDLPADFNLQNLHKLILSIKSDDSWHRVDAELTVGGKTWRSARSTYLAQHRPMSIIFQPPTFEDETYQPKIWVPLKQRAGGSGQSAGYNNLASGRTDQAALRIIITPSSTPRAIWGKLTRNYIRIFNSIPFWEYLGNSLLLVVLTVTGTLFSSTFVAYAFARLHWPGRSVALLILLSTLMLPEQVTMIPSFLIWQKLGWYNTLNPMWVPTFFGATFTPLFGSAFFIFLMVQHMKTLPKELEEAARIDGLNHVQTWWYIMLPQVKPAAAAIATLSFLAAWNDFLRPLIYLRDQGRFPLSLGLLTAQIENRGDWTMIMAGNVLMTVPVIVLFFLCQRYFVRGMSATGMK